MARLKQVSTVEAPSEAPLDRKWFWVFVFITLGCLAGVVSIIFVAIGDMNENLPSQIDVVLFDHETARYQQQIQAVQKHMKFIHQIFVLTTHQETVSRNFQTESRINVTYHKLPHGVDTQEAAFEHIPNLAPYGLSQRVMYLSDRTFPTYTILKTYLFHGKRPRMFNIMQDEAEKSFFVQNGYWEDTIVTMVGRLDLMRYTPSVALYVFEEVTREQVVLRNDMNRDVFVTSPEVVVPQVSAQEPQPKTSSEQQFGDLETHTPLFATFHLSGNKPEANQTLLKWLTITPLFRL